jgi:predicted nucleic acid-binding Zn ribbon protein
MAHTLNNACRHNPLWGIVVVIQRVYLDESASECPFLVSGWMARSDRWDSFSEKWQEILNAEPKIDYFSLNDALGLKGPFHGWKGAERDRKIIALAKVIPHDGTICGTGCYVQREVFEKNKQRIRRPIYREPYYFCVATTMIFMVKGEYQVVGADKIDFVLDRSRAAERMTELFYSQIRPLSPKLGECLTLNDRETMPLQAADLSVGMTRQLYEPSPRRIPGSYSLTGLFSAVFEIHSKGLEDAIASPLFSGSP